MSKIIALGLLLCVCSLFADPFGVDGFRITKAVGNTTRSKNAMATGPDSRVEITFYDHTIARLGANAKFQFTPGSREAVLDGGTILLHLPREAGGITLRAGRLIVESPGGDFVAYDVDDRNKVVCLNGKASVQLAGSKQKIKLSAGQMVDIFPGATSMPPPTKFSLQGLMGTSLLMAMGVLPSQQEIEKNATKQSASHAVPAPIPQVKSDPAPVAIAATGAAMTTMQLEMQQRAIAQAEAAQALAIQQVAERASQQEAARIAVQAAATKLEAERQIADQQAAAQEAAQQQAPEATGRGGDGDGQGRGPQGNRGRRVGQTR